MSVLSRRAGEPGPGIRIVHYHYVFDDELDSFRRQIAFIASEYEPVALREAVVRLEERRVGGREVVVTFDDGFRNQLANATPVLANHGVSACFFLVTDLLSAGARGAARICRDRLHLPRPVEPMGWEQAERLVELGHEIGSHTRSHPDLTTLSAPELGEELTASRKELERLLGVNVIHLSAPYGEAHRFSPAVSAAAVAAGYASCATAQRGLNTSADDLFALRRDHLEASWPVAHVRWFLARA